jgi:hypothetical protein
MPAEAAQLEMADLNDWFGNFNGESIGHEQGPADVLAEEFQPAENVDVAPSGGEVESRSDAWLSSSGSKTSRVAGNATAASIASINRSRDSMLQFYRVLPQKTKPAKIN